MIKAFCFLGLVLTVGAQFLPQAGGFAAGVPIYGVNNGFVGGVNNGFVGGVNNGFVGGYNTGLVGGLNTGFVGGLNTGFVGDNSGPVYQDNYVFNDVQVAIDIPYNVAVPQPYDVAVPVPVPFEQIVQVPRVQTVQQFYDVYVPGEEVLVNVPRVEYKYVDVVEDVRIPNYIEQIQEVAVIIDQPVAVPVAQPVAVPYPVEVQVGD